MYIKNGCLKFLGIIFFIPLFLSCKDDALDQNLFNGLWMPEQITEDGQTVNLSNAEKSLKLLIEDNGVYRTFSTDGITSSEHYGTWITTDDKWIDFTIDTWHVATDPTETKEGVWRKNHLLTRFTIISITDRQMVIRIKTYIGEKKYSTMFVENQRPSLTLQNIDDIKTEFKTYKTYIFTFRKGQ
jgi:hypothetical protein